MTFRPLSDYLPDFGTPSNKSRIRQLEIAVVMLAEEVKVLAKNQLTPSQKRLLEKLESE